MFEKIRGKAESLRKAGKDKDERRCALCARRLEDLGTAGWFTLRRAGGEEAYVCMDCAYRTYEAVDGIMEAYEQIALEAACADAGPDGADRADGTGERGTDPVDAAAGTGKKEEGCTPESAYARLSSRVVGQEHAKKVIAVAVYNHWKRMKMAEEGKSMPTGKSNILLIGPTGTGKTLLAEAAADILDVPFASVDATSLTETGYKGKDVDSAIEKLVMAADGDVERAEHGIIYIVKQHIKANPNNR